MKLMEKRSALETEMNVIIDRLCQPGGPELRNDHKEITEKINENIQVLHSARLATKDSVLPHLHGNDGVSNNQNSVVGNAFPSVTSHNVVLRDSSSSMDVDMMASVPFAVVDEITDASPTAEDGLQLGDQLVKFGTVEYQVGENLLQKLASEAQANQGHAVPVIVMRQGAPINLSVTPRVWPGRGLLGEGGWLVLLPVATLFRIGYSLVYKFVDSSIITTPKMGYANDQPAACRSNASPACEDGTCHSSLHFPNLGSEDCGPHDLH
ncbi:hypothetical protein D5086_013301 [Populus alba]|uniref:Uncharacterized protein n=1 Tax=Populus alba TaxID=43335 RepID=A0ACC4C4K3_POPAL